MKRKNKIHNYILKTITTIVAIIFALAVCALDSDSWIPMNICIVCLAWLLPFAVINGQ